MNFSISGHHITITDAIREHAAKKAEVLTHRIDNLINVKFTLTHDQSSKDKYTLDGIAYIKDNQLVASVKGNNGSEVYTMIDELVGKLERQLRKQKSKALSSKKGQPSIKHLEVVDQSVV